MDMIFYCWYILKLLMLTLDIVLKTTYNKLGRGARTPLKYKI
jgi:hypothetical protein